MGKLKPVIPYLLLLISYPGYVGFSFHFKRTDHFELFVAFVLLFGAYFLLIRLFNKTKLQFLLLFAFGLIFRLIFLISPPHLSDDYFRFTWDGELMKDGISPFAFQPRFYKDHLKERPDLLAKYEKLYNARTAEFPNGMNSPQYFSIYPTFNQGVFVLSSWLGSPNKGNVVIMRILMILAEVISFFVLRRLLLKKNKQSEWTHLYWLNPLVIIEFTGNLHFDGFAVAFLLLAFYFLLKEKWTLSVLSISAAIVTKLNPIFLFGAVFSQLKWKRTLVLGISTMLFVTILFGLILNIETFQNFTKSFGLYFAWFEFNTGLYAAFRDVGLLLTGVDWSSKLSLFFPAITFVLFLKVTFFSPKVTVEEKLLLLYFIYFSFSPIVHPWYIAILVPFGVLSGRLYPILWSFLVFFSYTAYKENGFSQSSWLIYSEYALVYVCFYLEMKTKRLDKFKSLVFTI